MRIYLKKFGTTLTSRQDGKEALAAFQPVLNNVPDNENIEIDFEGVITFTPSWGDEFLTALQKRYKDRLILLPVKNLSVKMTVEFLEKVNKIKFKILS